MRVASTHLNFTISEKGKDIARFIGEQESSLARWYRETIRKAETYCDRISEQVRQIPGSRERIIRMKQELLERNLYGFYKYSSMDVYRAVLEQGISDVEELLRRYQRGENRI